MIILITAVTAVTIQNQIKIVIIILKRVQNIFEIAFIILESIFLNTKTFSYFYDEWTIKLINMTTYLNLFYDDLL